MLDGPVGNPAVGDIADRLRSAGGRAILRRNLQVVLTGLVQLAIEYHRQVLAILEASGVRFRLKCPIEEIDRQASVTFVVPRLILCLLDLGAVIQNVEHLQRVNKTIIVSVIRCLVHVPLR